MPTFKERLAQVRAENREKRRLRMEEGLLSKQRQEEYQGQLRRSFVEDYEIWRDHANRHLLQQAAEAQTKVLEKIATKHLPSGIRAGKTAALEQLEQATALEKAVTAAFGPVKVQSFDPPVDGAWKEPPWSLETRLLPADCLAPIDYDPHIPPCPLCGHEMTEAYNHNQNQCERVNPRLAAQHERQYNRTMLAAMASYVPCSCGKDAARDSGQHSEWCSKRGMP